jgi:hypothetical protein
MPEACDEAFKEISGDLSGPLRAEPHYITVKWKT